MTSTVVGQALGATWGLHLVDVNISLGNLVELVGDQARSYTRSVSASRQMVQPVLAHSHVAPRGVQLPESSQSIVTVFQLRIVTGILSCLSR